jgi:PAS domain S-box-containing protein
VDEALKNERDFTAALLDTVGALVMVLDREGRVVRFNHACELATGFVFDKVRGTYYWDLLLPATEIESATTYFQQLQGGNFPSSYEGYWVSLDGNQRLIDWTNTCLVGETAGLVKLRKLTWKGSSRKAPETPPMEVKVERTRAIRGGMSGLTSTPDTGKSITHLLCNFSQD